MAPSAGAQREAWPRRLLPKQAGPETPTAACSLPARKFSDAASLYATQPSSMGRHCAANVATQADVGIVRTERRLFLRRQNSLVFCRAGLEVSLPNAT